MHNSSDHKTNHTTYPVYHCNLQFLRFPKEIVSYGEHHSDKNRSIVSHIKLATVKLNVSVVTVRFKSKYLCYLYRHFYTDL